MYYFKLIFFKIYDIIYIEKIKKELFYMMLIIVGIILIVGLIAIFMGLMYADKKRDEQFEEDIKKIQRGDRGFF